MFLLFFREHPCQNQRIGNRNYDQNSEMEQVHFRGKIRVICKGAECVDGGMDEDAGEQAAAAVKDRDQQEAYRDGKDDLTQVGHQIHAAAVEQIDNVPDAKGHAGDDDRRSYVFPCNGHQQKARKITSSKNPTQSMHTMRQTVSAGA